MNSVTADDLLEQMLELREGVYADGIKIYERWKPHIERESFHESAKNLAFYVALRSRDIRGLQDELAQRGLSSLGRLESRTMPTIDAVVASLAAITGREVENALYPPAESFYAGHQKLQEAAGAIFGHDQTKRNTAIMVTVQKEASTDLDYLVELLEAGTDVVRINCAHDNPKVWKKIIDNVRKAEKKTGKSCRVAVDIAGPKTRTQWTYCTKRKDRAVVGTKFLITKGMQPLADQDVKIQMGCSLPQILDDLNIGDRVLYDDGTLEGEVIERVEDGVIVRTTKTDSQKGVRFRVDKGLNFPNAVLRLPNLTEQDEEALDFVVGRVDIIDFSFIKNVADMERCIQAVEKRHKKGPKPAIVAKIETLQGIDNLADIVACGAGKSEFGVMIARGDLAVETGYLRLAELQQQILWICEAADVPAIWATQVLDQMVSHGIPSRAEVTDASEGAARTECVMLNRGDYLPETVHFLDELLIRMESNVYKKSPRLRALNIARKVKTHVDDGDAYDEEDRQGSEEA